MLHPVGDLPAAVYWRRRLLVLTLLLSLLGGGGWLGYALLAGRLAGTKGAAAPAALNRPAVTPRLELVVPPVAGVRTPTDPAPGRTTATTQTTSPAGRPCSDDMLTLEVRAPASAPTGGRPTVELVVTNSSPAPCTRALDQGRREIVLLDGQGRRIWGSNDCAPPAGADTRTLAPGEAASFPVVWDGLTSEPTCSAARSMPATGGYSLRGRLDTKISADAPITLGRAGA